MSTTETHTDDLVAATTRRWSFHTDESFADSVERNRVRRDARADAFHRLAKRTVDYDLPSPNVAFFSVEAAAVTVHYTVEDVELMRQLARAVRRACDGATATKSNDDGSLTTTILDGPLAWQIKLTPESSPCEKVQVGTETQVVREEIAPPRYREVEKDVPVYEYRCPDSILDGE